MKGKDWLAFILLGTIWGSSFLWIKVAVQEINPLLLVAFRLSFAILVLFLVVLLTRTRISLDRKMWVILLLFGFTNTAIPYLLISWGEQFIDSAVAAILNSTTPLFAMVIAHIFLEDDRITLPRLIGLIVGFFGIILLVSRDLVSLEIPEQTRLYLIFGQIAVLLASLLYAGSSVFSRRRMKGISLSVQGLVPLLAATSILWILTPVVENPVNFPQLPITWFSLAWLGILGTGFAFLLYFYLIHSVGPTRATLVTYIFPVVGVLLGVVFLDERLDWQLAIGAGMVVGSVVIVNTSKS